MQSEEKGEDMHGEMRGIFIYVFKKKKQRDVHYQGILLKEQRFLPFKKIQRNTWNSFWKPQKFLNKWVCSPNRTSDPTVRALFYNSATGRYSVGRTPAVINDKWWSQIDPPSAPSPRGCSSRAHCKSMRAGSVRTRTRFFDFPPWLCPLTRSSTKLRSSRTVPSVGPDFWTSVLPSHWLLARAPLSQFSQNPPPSIWDGAPHPHRPRVMSHHTGLPSAGIQLGRFSRDLPFPMMFLPWSSIHGPPPAPWLEIPTCPGCIQSGALSLLHGKTCLTNLWQVSWRIFCSVGSQTRLAGRGLVRMVQEVLNQNSGGKARPSRYNSGWPHAFTPHSSPQGKRRYKGGDKSRDWKRRTQALGSGRPGSEFGLLWLFSHATSGELLNQYQLRLQNKDHMTGLLRLRGLNKMM